MSVIQITDEAVEQRELDYHSGMFSWSELVREILHREAEIDAIKAQVAALNRWIELGAIGEHRGAEHGGDFATCRKLGCINARGFLRSNNAGAELLAERDALKAMLTEAEAADTANLAILLRQVGASTVDEAVRALAAEREARERVEASNKTLQDDVEELIFCEDCAEDCTKMPDNGCYPPRYCHGCRHKLVDRIISAERRAEANVIDAQHSEIMQWVDSFPRAKVHSTLNNALNQIKQDFDSLSARAERAERLLEAERQHSAALQEECNKAVDAMEWANGKKAKASQMIARLKPALEIYAKEENWYEAEDGATHRQYFTIYPDGRRLHGWEIAQQALDAPQERGAEAAEGVFFDVDGEECCNEELALSRLLEAEVLFCNTASKPETVCLYVLCNDIFAWALADAEDFTETDIPVLYRLWEANNIWGPIKWVCQKRNQQPQAPVARDMKAAGAWDEDMEKLEPNRFDNRRAAAALVPPGEAGKAEGEVSK